MSRISKHRFMRGFAATAILLGAILALVPVPIATPSAQAITWAVSIDDSGFHPDHLVVPVGATVVWMNDDSVQHTVTSVWNGPNPTPTLTPTPPGSIPPGPTPEPGVIFDLTIAPGDSGSVTFDQIGPFDYFCRDHPDEIADIVVTAIRETPTPSPSVPNAALPSTPAPIGSPLIAIGLILMAVGILSALATARAARRR